MEVVNGRVADTFRQSHVFSGSNELPSCSASCLCDFCQVGCACEACLPDPLAEIDEVGLVQVVFHYSPHVVSTTYGPQKIILGFQTHVGDVGEEDPEWPFFLALALAPQGGCWARAAAPPLLSLGWRVPLLCLETHRLWSWVS